MNFFKKKKAINIDGLDESIVYSPLNGKRIDLEDVDDSVFSSKMMGDGIAIEPINGKLYSPVSGEIAVVFSTKHAIGIKSSNGANIIIHIGIDTVELNGAGFKSFVKAKDKVKAGQLLVEFDLELIKRKYKATTMIVIENWEDYKLNKTLNDNLNAGDMLIEMKDKKNENY